MIWARFVLYTHEKGRFSLSFPSRISTTTITSTGVVSSCASLSFTWPEKHIMNTFFTLNENCLLHTVMYITMSQVVQNTVFFLLLMMRLLRWFICIDAESVMVNFLPGSHVFGVSLSRSPTQKTLCGLRVCWRRTFFPTNKSGQKP